MSTLRQRRCPLFGFTPSRCLGGLALGLLIVAALAVMTSAASADAGGGTTAAARSDGARLDAGSGHTCVVVATGSLRCWGQNTYGQLAQGNTANIGDGAGESTVPAPLPVGQTAVAVSGGDGHTCAIIGDGSVRCWGRNDHGELAQGNTASVGDSPGESTVQVQLPAGRTATAITAGGQFTCALLNDGTVRCWGYNQAGQLGQGNTTTIGDTPGETTVAVTMPTGRTVTSLSAGAGHVCAILDDGTLRCWGHNAFGQLAQGNAENIGDSGLESTVAVALPEGRTAKAVASGEGHTCVILDDGNVRCWGRNDSGQLAQGNTINVGDVPGQTTVPVSLPAGRTAVAITAGSNHTCVILDSGAMRCWGHNQSGQLGQGNTQAVGNTFGQTTVPVNLGTGRTAVTASAGSGHTCVILDDGGVRCWGYNIVGQLGRGNTSNYGDNAGELPSALTPISMAGVSALPDQDGDGVPDSRDACPRVAAKTDTGCAAPGAGAAPPPSVEVPKGDAPAATGPALRPGLGMLTLTKRLTLRWGPDVAQAATLRVRWAPLGGAFRPLNRTIGSTDTSATFSVTPGGTYCATLTPAGATTPVSIGRRCTTVPVGAQSLKAGGPWVRQWKPRAFLGRVRSTHRVGATLTMRPVRFRRLFLIATTGPERGRVGVSVGGRVVRHVNLTSSTVTRRVVLPVVRLAASVEAPVVIRVERAPVGIEGLALVGS